MKAGTQKYRRQCQLPDCHQLVRHNGARFCSPAHSKQDAAKGAESRKKSALCPKCGHDLKKRGRPKKNAGAEVSA